MSDFCLLKMDFICISAQALKSQEWTQIWWLEDIFSTNFMLEIRLYYGLALWFTYLQEY